MPASDHPSDGTVTAPPSIIPGDLSGAGKFSVTVTALDDDDAVLLRLDAGHLTVELPMPSAVATDLTIRLAGCCMRLSCVR